MSVEQQPAKRTGMNSSHPQTENELGTIGEKVATSYGKGAAEEAGKKTVEYAADPESGAQEHIDNVKSSRIGMVGKDVSMLRKCNLNSVPGVKRSAPVIVVIVKKLKGTGIGAVDVDIVR